MNIYLIGSLRNPEIPKIAEQLRDAGYDVFDDWHSAGPEADDSWQAYEEDRGRSFAEALDGAHATNVFEFDKKNIEAADVVVMVMPAGKSAHLELGWSLGHGKPGFVLLNDEPERFDVMYRFADGIAMDVQHLTNLLRRIDA